MRNISFIFIIIILLLLLLLLEKRNDYNRSRQFSKNILGLWSLNIWILFYWGFYISLQDIYRENIRHNYLIIQGIRILLINCHKPMGVSMGRVYFFLFQPCSFIIDHFTVVSLVTWPLNGNEAGVDHVLIQTSLFLLCNQVVFMLTRLHLHGKSREVCTKALPTATSLAFMAR